MTAIKMFDLLMAPSAAVWYAEVRDAKSQRSIQTDMSAATSNLRPRMSRLLHSALSL